MAKAMMLLLALAGIALPASAPAVQTDRMKSCNARARSDGLEGEPRKQFMRQCLSSKPAETLRDGKAQLDGPGNREPVESGTLAELVKAEDKSLEKPQQAGPPAGPQQKMKTCNAEAKTRRLRGQPRREFMSSCLSN